LSSGRPPVVESMDGEKALPRCRIVGLSTIDGRSSKTNGPEKLLAYATSAASKMMVLASQLLRVSSQGRKDREAKTVGSFLTMDW